MRKIVGKETYVECICFPLAAIGAAFLSSLALFHQERPREGYLRKE